MYLLVSIAPVGGERAGGAPGRNTGALVQQNMEALQAENLRASGTNQDSSSAPSLRSTSSTDIAPPPAPGPAPVRPAAAQALGWVYDPVGHALSAGAWSARGTRA